MSLISAPKTLLQKPVFLSLTQRLAVSLVVVVTLIHSSLQGRYCPEENVGDCLACRIGGICKKCAYVLTPKNTSQPQCTNIKITIKNCYQQQEGTTDCKQCLPGYYVSDDKKSCLKGPIDNCYRYQGIGVVKPHIKQDFFKNCELCKPGFLTKDASLKECIPVPEESKVEHCQYYVRRVSGNSNIDACYQCKEGYALNKTVGISEKCYKTEMVGCRVQYVYKHPFYCYWCRHSDNYFETRGDCRKSTFVPANDDDEGKWSFLQTGSMISSLLLLLFL